MTISFTSATALELVVSNASGSLTSVQKEIDLIKAGLLYGDSVSVISPLVTFTKSFLDIDDWQMNDIKNFLSGAGEFLTNTEGVLNTVARLESGAILSDEDRLKLEELLWNFKKVLVEHKGFPEARITDGSLEELKKALSSGFVQVRNHLPLSNSELVARYLAQVLRDPDSTVATPRIEQLLTDSFLEQLCSELSDGDGYLLLDPTASEVIHSLTKSGRLNLRHGSHSRLMQAGIAFQMMGFLPSFPRARIDEILDIRDELSGPVIRFRSEIARLTRELDAGAADEVSPVEVHDAWVEVVAPALQSIQDRIDELKLKRLYASNMLELQTSPGLIVMGAGLLTGHVPADIGGLLLSQLSTGLKSALDRAKGSKKLSAMPFYFLYETEHLLHGGL